jgi:hypothetical protein
MAIFQTVFNYHIKLSKIHFKLLEFKNFIYLNFLQAIFL